MSQNSTATFGAGSAKSSEAGSHGSVEVTAVGSFTKIPGPSQSPGAYTKVRPTSAPQRRLQPLAAQGVSHPHLVRQEEKPASAGPAVDPAPLSGPYFGSIGGLGGQAARPAKVVGEIVLSGAEAEHAAEGIGSATTQRLVSG